MRLLRHTGVYGLWLHQAKPTSDQGEDLSLFSSLRGGPAPRAMDHWCENSLCGSPFSSLRGECDASATSMNWCENSLCGSSFSSLRGGPPRAMDHLGE